MFRAIYLSLCFILWLIFLPILIILSFKEKYRVSIPKRFFYPFNFSKNFKPSIWIHACSFGEIKSLEPIIDSIKNENILLSVTTQTGFNLAKQTYEAESNIRVEFLPFEIFLPFIRFRLKSLKMLVVTEAELWFEVFYSAKKINAKTILINARLSDKSFPKYKKFSFFYKRLFDLIDLILAQSETDLNRFLEINNKLNVKVFGNLKILNPPKITKKYKKFNTPLILAASTHDGEEDLILKAFNNLDSNEILAIAPRHPERFNIVESKLKNPALLSRLDSSINNENEIELNLGDKKIILIDKLGELNNFYNIADVALLGGAWSKNGGHNPLEPAFFNTRLISGENIFNQKALFSNVENYTLTNEKNLESTLKNYKNLPKSNIKKTDMNLENLISILKASNGKSL